MVKKLLVTNVPERKKPILCVKEGICSRIIASFKNDEAAEEFCQIYNQIIDEVYEKGLWEGTTRK